MKNTIISVVVSLVVCSVLLVAAFNMPSKYLSIKHWFGDYTLGATLLTVLTSDNVADFPSVYNTNNATLNLRKPDLSDLYSTTTSQFAWTTLSSLATVGTITSGTWNGTAIQPPYGGTGSTTLTANMILIGNGTSPIKSTPVQGANGEFLGMSGGVPTWLPAGTDQTANYTWTGTHGFQATTTQSRFCLGSFCFASPTLQMATSTALGVGTTTVNTGSQAYLAPLNFSRTLEASTTLPSLAGSSNESTLWGSYIPADTLCTFGGCNGSIVVKIRGTADCHGQGGFHIYLYYGSVTVPVAGADDICKNDLGRAGFELEAVLVATSTNNQRGTIFAKNTGKMSNTSSSALGGFDLMATTTPTNFTSNASGYVTTNAGVQQQLRITAKFDTSNANNAVIPWLGTLEVIKP